MSTANLIRAAGVAVVMWVAALASGCSPQPEAHTSFATADEAVTALVAAIEKGDPATLGKVLGPGSEEIISSGDPVADKADRDAFIASYREKHELVADGDSRRILQVGAADWPSPVPVVQRDGRWYLDGAEGADEVIYRRVGENELGAIAVARGFREAQFEYAAKARDGNPSGIYAQKLFSDPGRQNGLYWPTTDGELPSPAGPFIASAGRRGLPGRRGGSTCSLPRLLLPVPVWPGPVGERWRHELLHRRPPHRRLCADRMARRLRRQRRDDLLDQPRRGGVPEGPGRGHRRHRREDPGFRSRRHLATPG